jgi:hypothetical protein
MRVSVKQIDVTDGTKWVELNGADHGTAWNFDNETFGVTDDNRILNCDGCPLTPGDNQEIAVRNALGL